MHDNEWQIQIKAEREEFKDYYNFAGMRDEANSKWDILDIGEPPTIGNYVSVYFDHTNWKEGAGRYSADFRAPEFKGYEYYFVVESNFEGCTKLSFEPHNIPESFSWASFA